MIDEDREVALQMAVGETECAGEILCRATISASQRGRGRLFGAYTHLYAVLFTEFIRDTEHPGWIGPSVQMNDGETKSTRDFVFDHLFDTILRPLVAKKDGEEFLLRIRRKAHLILDGYQNPGNETPAKLGGIAK